MKIGNRKVTLMWQRNNSRGADYYYRAHLRRFAAWRWGWKT